MENIIITTNDQINAIIQTLTSLNQSMELVLKVINPQIEVVTAKSDLLTKGEFCKKYGKAPSWLDKCINENLIDIVTVGRRDYINETEWLKLNSNIDKSFIKKGNKRTKLPNY